MVEQILPFTDIYIGDIKTEFQHLLKFLIHIRQGQLAGINSLHIIDKDNSNKVFKIKELTMMDKKTKAKVP